VNNSLVAVAAVSANDIYAFGYSPLVHTLSTGIARAGASSLPRAESPRSTRRRPSAMGPSRPSASGPTTAESSWRIEDAAMRGPGPGLRRGASSPQPSPEAFVA
jgi:hypothetical protein